MSVVISGRDKGASLQIRRRDNLEVSDYITVKHNTDASLQPSEESMRDLAGVIRSVGAFIDSEDGIVLSSGQCSRFYFDLKKLNGDARGIHTVAQIMHGMALQLGVQSVGGLESGSVGMAAAISQLSHMRDPDRPITSFYVRKEPKEHGMKNLIEGIPRSPVVIIDDVITTGASALRAAGAVREEGHECAGILSIIFRGGQKHRERLREEGGSFHYLFAESYFTGR